MELNHNYDGKTRLRAWWKQVKANFQAIESHADETDAAIASEKAERESGAIHGDENGRLGLTEDLVKTLTILDRVGVI